MRLRFKPIIAAAVVFALPFWGCGKDDPTPADGSEISNERQPDNGYEEPESPDNNGNQDDDSTDSDEDSDTRGITGTWSNSEGIGFTFESDGNFTGIVTRKMGFKVSGTEEVDGTYTYDDFKQFLWLSTRGENEVYLVEFSCRISDDTMRLYGMSGTGLIELKRAK